ncbi:Glycine dehydrogenase (decarboxylating) [Parasponia andersonii]|uniref:Glycine dehydrogenase (Decarboxylating) n=1 Tax=Parasponia andersonii TaxID=3476 RepID=A0A2P5CIG8_PARAD|nr:Glycine dehydrogenase (decarboxylating) [Parasponia andersonii]
MEVTSSWDKWVEDALSKLESLHLLRSLRPIYLRNEPEHPIKADAPIQDEFQVFDEMQQWDRSSVEIQISDATFQKWVNHISSSGDEADSRRMESPQRYKKLLLFSGNDYLGLSSHPTIGKAAAKAAQEHGMGPRGSALICGYTNYHRLLESCLADLKKKEDCLLCPTGFAANMALMVTLGNVGSLLASGTKSLKHERVAIFSDALNHASIIDGIHLAERQHSVEVFIYRHCNMTHLNTLLSSCPLRKKVVVTDSLFSMDGDFAPMIELVRLRKKYGFLLVIDDAHGTFVCGKSGGGVGEEFNCEKDIDICVGTLSKAAGCHGGFIACRQLLYILLPRSQKVEATNTIKRSLFYIFDCYTSTCCGCIPWYDLAAAVIVARKEMWRRRAIWDRVQDFRTLTGIPISSPIISLIIGSEDKALDASQHLLRSGLHVTAIRPPTVPPNSCRLRVTLTAAHTRNDLERLTNALSCCLDLKEISVNSSNAYARM